MLPVLPAEPAHERPTRWCAPAPRRMQVAAAEAASAGDQAFNIGAEGHTKQQQAAFSMPPDECLRQLKQIGYAEADLLTLHPSQQQQLLAQHMTQQQQQQQEAVPHMPDPAQAHQPKCCVIQ
jgi:hypothetical protein